MASESQVNDQTQREAGSNSQCSLMHSCDHAHRHLPQTSTNATDCINEHTLADRQDLQFTENAESSKLKETQESISSSSCSEERKKVRLHHPQTRRQIGEAVYLNYQSDRVLLFELVTHPGRMMRVNGTGKVEFAAAHDATCFFEMEVLSSGALHLLCSAYREVENVHGGKGWYLSMSQHGQLTGNGGKGEHSQWMMLTEKPAATGATGLVNTEGTIGSPDTTTSSSSNSSTTNTTNSTTNTIKPLPLTPSGPPALHSAAVNGSVGINNSGSDAVYPGVGAGVDALMRYFMTASGAKFLQQPEYNAAYMLYLNGGQLAKILHRPDWPLVANYYIDHTALPLPPMQKSVVDSCVSFAELKSYFDQGYVVCNNIVPSDRIHNALRIVNYYTSRFVCATPSTSTSTTGGTQAVGIVGEGLSHLPGNRIQFNGAISSDIDILSLFYTTPLTHIVQRLIGAGDVAHPTHATIVTTHPTIELTPNPALFNDQWYMDGDHSPYMMLVGVALTDIVHDGGAYCVHSASHLVVMSEYQDEVRNRSTLLSKDPSTVKKMDLGQPTQLTMKAGDVFLCSPHTAYLHSLNTTSTPTTIVYFNINHVDTAVDSTLVEYQQAQYFLDHRNELDAEQRSATSSDATSSVSPVYGGVNIVLV